LEDELIPIELDTYKQPAAGAAVRKGFFTLDIPGVEATDPAFMDLST
jgi:hypothetical protein